MRIGIPEALLFQRYEPMIRAFFDNLGVDVVYSGPSNRNILERGIRSCVDEACLPMKLFQGHVSKLQEECDKVVVPRLMKCEYGDSICPKFSGLPELIGKGNPGSKLAFTEPLYLSNRDKLRRTLVRQGRQIGVSKEKVAEAFRAGELAARRRNTVQAQADDGFGNGGIASISRVALLGHPYNIYDSFANMNLVNKLNRLGISAVTGEFVPIEEINREMAGLMKTPYWLFYRENLGMAGALLKKGNIDGIVYVSSFCCGTDSVIIEMIRSRLEDFPMLVLKLDEHTAEAGVDTRLEAFAELLERRKRLNRDSYSFGLKQIHAKGEEIRETNLSENRGQSHLWTPALSGTGDRYRHSCPQ